MSFHGEADCALCGRRLTRDMYGCWWHMGGDAGHDPRVPLEVLKGILVASRKAQTHAVMRMVKQQHKEWPWPEIGPGEPESVRIGWNAAIDFIWDTLREDT